MIKIGEVPKGADPNSYTVIERETASQYKGRPIRVALLRGGVKVWLKGMHDFYVVPYEVLFRDGERGSVSIPARKVSAAKLAKIVAANREKEDEQATS
jgi:hypothetical protein